MRRHILRGSIGIGLAAALFVAPLVTRDARAQEIEIVDSAITLSSSGRAELWFELSDRSEHRLLFDDGAIEFDGASLGSYREGGRLASAWRDFLRSNAGAEGAAMRAGLLDFRARLETWETDGNADERAAMRELGNQVDRVFDLAVEAAEEPSTISARDVTSLRIVPGGLGFDVTESLDRLKEGLRRLGDAGESLDDPLAMIVHGDYQIPSDSEIAGHVAVLDGTLRLAGKIEGNVLILDGRLLLTDGARIEGDVLQVGGELELAGDARIEGEILSDLVLAPVAPVAPSVQEAPVVEATRSVVSSRGSSARNRGPFARFARNVGHAAEGLMGAFSTFIGLAVLGVLLIYFAHGRLETVSDTVRHEFGRSFAMGLAGQVLFFPALLVLLVLVITWPIVPFFVLGAALAGLVGYLAVAHGAGEMFAQRRYRYEWLERIRRSNSYYYLISGLVLLMLPFAAGAVLWVLGGSVDVVRGLIVFVACVGTWVLATAGFGSVLLTRAGGRSVVIDWSSGPDTDTDVGDPGADGPPESPASGSDGEPSEVSEADITLDESSDD